RHSAPRRNARDGGAGSEPDDLFDGHNTQSTAERSGTHDQASDQPGNSVCNFTGSLERCGELQRTRAGAARSGDDTCAATSGGADCGRSRSVVATAPTAAAPVAATDRAV